MTLDAVSSPAGAARYAGTRVRRVEDPRLLTGTGTYVDDIVRPGMVHACFVRSPFARARIIGVDPAAALAIPGVLAVFAAPDINPAVHELWYTGQGSRIPDTPRPLLAEGEARFAGDPVALVVAVDRYVAEDAAELVDVDYEPLPAVSDYRQARSSEAMVHDGWSGNVAGAMSGAPPEALAGAFAEAAVVVSETIVQQGATAVPIETRGLVVEWSAPSRELTVWAATQSPHEVRAVCARVLGLPEHHVRVIAGDTGGGFGQKVIPLREDLCVVVAATKLGVPLKWIEDRRENLMSAGQARREHGLAEMAFGADGSMLAARIDHVQDVGAYPSPWPVGTAAATGLLFPGPYRVPAASYSSTCVFSNSAGRTAYRGPWQFESTAREMLLDISARRMDLDPIELRRRNLLRIDEFPFVNPNGMTYDNMSPLETFDAAIARLDLDAFRREQSEARAQGRYLGVGTSSYAEPTTTGMGFYATEGATIRVEPSGRVNVYVAGGSSGNSLETTVVQLTADALGVDPADVHTIQGDTAVTPFGAGTGGSRSGSMLAGAIATTAADLRERIVAIAAHRLEAAPDDIVLADSRATVRGTPSIGLSLAEIADRAYFKPGSLPPGTPAGLEASGRHTTPAMNLWANATHVCTCEVDRDTGLVTLLRYIVAEDCGPMINPDVVEGQIDGGTVQGIGEALLEHLALDEDGNPITTTFLDYLVPSMTDVPVIEHVHVETPSPGPGGYKGVGEGGAIGAPPAVANAVADALAPLGVTITEIPVTPAMIVGLIASATA